MSRKLSSSSLSVEQTLVGKDPLLSHVGIRFSFSLSIFSFSLLSRPCTVSRILAKVDDFMKPVWECS